MTRVKPPLAIALPSLTGMPFPAQHPVNVPWKAAEDSLGVWAPAIHAGYQDGVLAPGLGLGLDLAVTSIWGMNQQM